MVRLRPKELHRPCVHRRAANAALGTAADAYRSRCVCRFQTKFEGVVLNKASYIGM